MSQPWSDLAGYTILVVDDNEDTCAVLRTMLEAHGAHVRTAGSVDEARRALAHELPDVLITDLAMPVEDGYGLLEYCREHADPRLQKLSIVALTAYGSQLAQERVMAAGFDAYLAKPVEPSEVGKIVKELAIRKSSSAH
jgi:CheY-like chemotaxis protein